MDICAVESLLSWCQLLRREQACTLRATLHTAVCNTLLSPLSTWAFLIECFSAVAEETWPSCFVQLLYSEIITPIYPTRKKKGNNNLTNSKVALFY